MNMNCSKSWTPSSQFPLVKRNGLLDGIKQRLQRLPNHQMSENKESKFRNRTESTRAGSTPCVLAILTRASTFSRVLTRYPIIFAAFAARCAGVAVLTVCTSIGGGYIADQNWRRNSLAAVWQVVICRKSPSGISSLIE